MRTTKLTFAFSLLILLGVFSSGCSVEKMTGVGTPIDPAIPRTDTQTQSADDSGGGSTGGSSSGSTAGTTGGATGGTTGSGVRSLITVTAKVRDILKQTESFGKVDILFVVDNSGSMAAWQKALADNTAAFINTFSTTAPQMDAKFGMISTDATNAPYLGFDVPAYLNDPDIISKFTNAVSRLGISGSGVEMSYHPIKTALNNYSNFLRPNAKLAIVVISDAPEQSGRLASPITTPDFLNYLITKKSSLDDVLAYGSFGPQPQCTQTDDMWAWTGSVYEAFINGLHGRWYPLCGNFGANLASLSQDLIQRTYTARIPLPQPADVYTLHVREENTELTKDWYQYNQENTSIDFQRFDFANPDDTLTVTYYPR